MIKDAYKLDVSVKPPRAPVRGILIRMAKLSVAFPHSSPPSQAGHSGEGE